MRSCRPTTTGWRTRSGRLPLKGRTGSPAAQLACWSASCGGGALGESVWPRAALVPEGCPCAVNLRTRPAALQNCCRIAGCQPQTSDPRGRQYGFAADILNASGRLGTVIRSAMPNVGGGRDRSFACGRGVEREKMGPSKGNGATARVLKGHSLTWRLQVPMKESRRPNALIGMTLRGGQIAAGRT